MDKISLGATVAATRAVVKGREDHIEHSATYLCQDNPQCLVGHVVRTLIPHTTFREEFKVYLQPWTGRFTEDAISFLAVVQESQDVGEPWEDAMLDGLDYVTKYGLF